MALPVLNEADVIGLKLNKASNQLLIPAHSYFNCCTHTNTQAHTSIRMTATSGDVQREAACC